MTVEELKEALDAYPDDMEVYLNPMGCEEYASVDNVESVECEDKYILLLDDF